MFTSEIEFLETVERGDLFYGLGPTIPVKLRLLSISRVNGEISVLIADEAKSMKKVPLASLLKEEIFPTRHSAHRRLREKQRRRFATVLPA